MTREEILKRNFPEQESGYSYDALDKVTKASINKAINEILEQPISQLENGRTYLMQVEPSDITPSDALEAFGLGRNGLGE